MRTFRFLRTGGVLALVMSLSLTACGDDDDGGSSSSSSQSVSAIKTSDGKTVLLESVGSLKFGYDNQGRCTDYNWGSHIFFSYDPFTVISSYDYDASLNLSGYIESLSNGDDTYEFSYDSSGHLKLITETYGGKTDYMSLEWSNGNLISILEVEEGYSSYIKYEFEYSSYKNRNVYTHAYMDYFDWVGFEGLSMIGLFGKGPDNLPSAVYENYYSGNGSLRSSNESEIEYTLNSNGTIESETKTIDSETIDVRNYTYTTLSE